LAYQTDWGDLDYLIIDMPPGTGDIALTCAKKLPLTAAILVTTPHHLALMDAQRACEMFKKMHCPLLGVVSNMAYFTCTYCDEAHQLFAGPVDEFIRNNELNTLSTFPLAQDSAQLLWSTLAARSAAGLCCLQERRGVRMPPVVAETV
jgi:ATP-binding protein involved in chromosome partitioning